MELRSFGTTGMQVPVIGQGTWMMERDPKGAVAALRHGIDLGMTHIDTAEMYGAGRVEELVGEAIAGIREEVFLASKVLPSNASRRGTVEACERSLRRLRTDRLDLYLLHWPSHHPLEETVAGFEELRRAGKIRAFGVSNFDKDEMQRAMATSGPGGIACNQVLYHLKERAIEHAVIPFCERHGVAVVAYSPFGQGDFPSTNPVLAGIASAHGANPRQVALRFLCRQPHMFTIPKAANLEHVEENAAAGDLVLTEAELAAIDRAFPLGRPRRGVPLL
jgi:diketogulonate reductase-like aldo/keto reductase